MSGDSVAVLREIVAFLLGEAPLDGRWFGEHNNSVNGQRAQPYWWRTPLREAFDAALSAQGAAVAFRFTHHGKRSQWLDVKTELVHYGTHGNLIAGPHPDWQLEYAYTAPGGVGGAVTEEMVKAAGDAVAAYWENIVSDPCKRCAGRGMHHGFGEDGNDPDWCDECGGSGMAEAGSDDQALRAGLIAALAARTGKGDR